MNYLLVFSSFSLLASAETYKWFDENGRTYYGDLNIKLANRAVETLDIKINTYKSTTFEKPDVYVEKVVMYSAQWCGFCKKARKYFVANRIPFIEYDVEKDVGAKRRYEK